MAANDDMYCILCHGRGLDSKDHICRRCKGTGYEPEVLEAGGGPAGCQFATHTFQVQPSHLLNDKTI